MVTNPFLKFDLNFIVWKSQLKNKKEMRIYASEITVFMNCI